MLKKIYNIIFTISFPVVYIHKIFSNFFYIRYGEANPDRIGHLVGELSLWYLERKSEKVKNNNGKANLEKGMLKV